MAHADQSTTPRAAALALMEEKSLPPPPLEELLEERRQNIEEASARRGRLAAERASESLLPSPATSQASPSTPPQAYELPQSWPSSSSPSSLSPPQFAGHIAQRSPRRSSAVSESSCQSASLVSAPAVRLHDTVAASTISSRRRNDSRASASSSSSMPFCTPLPQKSPSPPSTHRETNSSASHTSSSDQSSQADVSARGSLWSNGHMSRNTSWSTHVSTPLTTASASRDWNHGLSAGDAERLRHCDTSCGLGISSDVDTATAPSRQRSRAPLLVSSSSSSSQPVSTDGDNLVASAVRVIEGSRQGQRGPHSPASRGSKKSLPSSPSSPPSSADIFKTLADAGFTRANSGTSQSPGRRPSLARMMSEPGPTEGPGSTSPLKKGGPISAMLPPNSIPPRTNSRTRTRSEACKAHRRQASQLSNSSAIEDLQAIPAGSYSPRKSSLRRTSRHRAASSASSTHSLALKTSISLRSLAGSGVAAGPAHKANRDSVREMPEAEELQTPYMDAPSKEPSHRFWSGRARTTSSVTSSTFSVDLGALALELAQTLPEGESLEVGNAVKYMEQGRGVVIEALGRPLEQFEHDVGPGTTHLLLSGCRDTRLPSFLASALALSADSLLVLDLSDTGLEEIPTNLSACRQLEELNLNGLKLRRKALSDSVDNLANLRVLLLDGQELTSMPICVSRLTRLKTLSVCNNRLRHLPSWLCNLQHLERLYLAGNPFQGMWLQVVSSIFPRQFGSEALRGAYAVAPSPVDSPASAGSASVYALGEGADDATRARQAALPRMRSENDVNKKLFPMSSPSRLVLGLGSTPSPADLQRQSESPSAPGVALADRFAGQGLMQQRKGPPLDRDATVKARPSEGGESKWAFLRKVTRKTSQPHSLNGSAASLSMSTTTGSPGGTPNSASALGSGASSPVSMRSHGTTSDPRQLPRLQTASSALNWQTPGGPLSGRLSSPAETSSSHGGQLLAAFEPTLPSAPSAARDTTRSGLCAPSDVASAKRRSFLDVEHASSYTAASSGAAPGANAEDALEWRSKMHGLMCYLKDLDDLAPAAVAWRRAVSTSSSAASPRQTCKAGPDPASPSPASAGGAEEYSPIRRRPSAMLLGGPLLPASTEIRDDSRRRRRIIAEIISSEESYLRGLQELCDIYVKPSRLADDKGGHPILSPQDHRAIFGNVEGLLQFHSSAFLPSLKSAAAALLAAPDDDGQDENDADRQLTAQVAEEVALVFIRHSGWFRMYSAYINGCDGAQSRIAAHLASSGSSSSSSSSSSAAAAAAASALRSVATVPASDASGARAHGGHGAQQLPGPSSGQRKRFKAFMKRCRADVRHSQLSVESYLLLPVQRIPRYELLLRDLARSTCPDRLEDPTRLRSALGEISWIAASVNESKRQSEQDRKLLAWQSRLRFRGPYEHQGPLVQPHRRLLRDGQLYLRRVVRRVQADDGHVEGQGDDGDDDADGLARAVSEARCDGSYSADLRHVCCLQQQVVSQRVTVLACNDVCVLAKDASPAAPLDVTAMLRFPTLGAAAAAGGGTSTTAPRCQVLGQAYLRVVDGDRVFYFTAEDHSDAVSWCQSFNAVVGYGER
ncbi:unnamed protein product [Parajaminaea phylloscopi]